MSLDCQSYINLFFLKKEEKKKGNLGLWTSRAALQFVVNWLLILAHKWHGRRKNLKAERVQRHLRNWGREKPKENFGGKDLPEVLGRYGLIMNYDITVIISTYYCEYRILRLFACFDFDICLADSELRRCKCIITSTCRNCAVKK